LALDGSELAEQALPHAAAQAEGCGAELVLLQVVEPFPSAGVLWQADIERAEKQAIKLACDHLQQLALPVQERGIAVRTVVDRGYPNQGIVRYAEMNDVDLIVICTRGRSGFSRWLMGSVADRVVRGATVPVLLIPAAKEN
jgi:nucleotide-binding universal stress UspA family protein